uniref:Uncharacterized protein n=1 Tax=Arion vulgaris TaxID=1028688 RepID=A0A0B6Y8V4_9EUPU
MGCLLQNYSLSVTWITFSKYDKKELEQQSTNNQDVHFEVRTLSNCKAGKKL